MTYDLFIGDRAYSSWSLRGWLLFAKFDLPMRVHNVNFATAGVAEQLGDMAPAKTVPCMRTPQGTRVWDSLAMAEELHERHPTAGLWPSDPALRATGRSLAAEMHSGFSSLRSECPMNLRTAYDKPPLSDETLADIARIETIWTHAFKHSDGSGPWLLGAYSIADVAFAPVAARFAGYDVELSTRARAYVDCHLSDLAFRRWRTMALCQGETLPWYAKAFATKPWPGPQLRHAKAIADGPSENLACPYTGGQPAYFLEIDGRVFGFENALCRDETRLDPDAWPAFSALL